MQFLVDTGADVSVIPRTRTNGTLQRRFFQLYAANGTVIPTYGTKRLKLDLGLRREFAWNFVVAEVTQPILCNDFLHEYDLLPDLRGRRLLDATTTLTAKGCLITADTPTLTTVDANNAYHDILREYIEVTLPAKYSEPRHPVRHHITTKGPPCTDRVRRLTPEKYKYAKHEIETWIADGVIRPSNSPYSSAMVMQPKADGSWRICGDYRRLNRITVHDKYPVPHLRDFAHKLHGRTVFTTLDLERAYFNIPMSPEDRKKTAC